MDLHHEVRPSRGLSGEYGEPELSMVIRVLDPAEVTGNTRIPVNRRN